MTNKKNGPQVLESPRDREDLAGGEAPATVSQSADSAHQGDTLFAATTALPVARPVPVQTSGRLEFAARCPECRIWHRHVSLGEKDAPCGAHYRLEFASKGAA
ncbi:hypothetical protein [Streptomyces griseosporeus]|uniref:hypothetical protein n=1 Tax=Streptomyces griseosporeus TaxID=1910 RepID=UPI0037013E5B